jgi:penicillin-binding protein 1B
MFKRLKPKHFLTLSLAGLVALALFTAYLDFTVRARFEGKRFKLPAKVYARALELYPGERLSLAELKQELGRLRYRELAQPPQEPGTFRAIGEVLELVSRPFVFADGPQPSRQLRIEFAGDQLRGMTNAEGAALSLVRLDPPLIGGIYPGNYEDRVLVRLAEVPEAVTQGLIAVEDRRFYAHHGIDPRGMARALFRTASGDGVQGGSTLTQQLAKNFFLTPARTLRRKFTEMIMALLLEAHYSKQEILETYINEVYLGQDGNRAVHGFGLAAAFFFNKPLSQLDAAESALLVGMLKGPTYFNPRSHPQRALERRNLVLAKMAEENFLPAERLRATQAEPLGVVERPPGSVSPYPAFLSLVYRQLKRDYRDADLRSEGLRIFTTLDPVVQKAAETALAQGLARLEKQRGMASGTLQGALLATSPGNAEVQAVVGGRDPQFEGFNRALDARRPIGSLIKPVVYLTALQQPGTYTLATLLDDNPLVLQQPGAADWAPQNYDKEFRGQVSLREALVHSYNVPTVNLGLALGVPRVLASLRRLGVEEELPEFASSLLGATALSPLEVTQVYQTLAGGGFYTPLRAIEAVLTADGETLQRYPLNVEQVVEPAPLFLLTRTLQDVVREGTAAGLTRYLPPELAVAGKTGTTDEFRDSWFAGFTGDRLAVVWVGRDDNAPMGLTGATGAMTVWGEMMADLRPGPLVLAQPANVEQSWIDPASGLLSARGCRDAVELPFVAGSAPTEFVPCGSGSLKRTVKGFFERIFGR